MISPQQTRSTDMVSPFEKTPDLSPFIHEFFMVVAGGFRGMAYCDEEGKWRTAYMNQELSGDICIFE